MESHTRATKHCPWTCAYILVALTAGCLGQTDSEASVAKRAEAVTATAEPESTCDADLLAAGASSPDACQGPWIYERYDTCTLERADECGTRCVEYQSCPDWGRRSTQEGSKTVHYDVSETCRVEFECTGGASRPAGGYGGYGGYGGGYGGGRGGSCRRFTICDPDSSEGSSKCDQEASRYRSRIISDYGIPHAYRGEVRVTKRVTYHNRTNLDMRATCKLDIEYPVAPHTTRSACGCKRSEPRSCPVQDRECGSDGGTHWSAAGLTRSELKASDPMAATDIGGARVECSTCEAMEVDPADASSVRAKYECLERAWASLGGELPAGFAPKVAQDLRLLLELGGHHLDEGARALIRDVYREQAAAEHACSQPPVTPGLNAVAIPAACPDATRYAAELNRCEHLTPSHVAPEVAFVEAPSCLAFLEELNALGATDADADCAGPELREAMVLATGHLVENAMGALRVEGGEFAGLPRAIHLVGRWHELAGESGILPVPPREEDDVRPTLAAFVEDRTSEHFGAFWKHLHASRRVLDGLGDDSVDVEVAIGEATERGLSLDREVLSAAYTPLSAIPGITEGGVEVAAPIPLDGGLPIGGDPLLAITADGLGGLTKRLEDLRLYHDLACLYLGCSGAESTELAQLWALVARLESVDDPATAEVEPDLENQVLDTVGGLGGWRDVFARIADAQGALIAAVSDVTGGGRLADATPSELPTMVAPLFHRVRDADARTRAFEQTGQLDPTLRRTLHAGLNAQQQDRVKTALEQNAGLLATAVSDYRAGLADVVAGLVSQQETELSLARIDAERTRLTERYDRISEDLDGLRIHMGEGDGNLAELVDRFAAIEGSIDDGAYLQLTSPGTVNLSVDGTAGEYDGSSHNLTQVSFREPFQVDRGQVLTLSTAGRYSPTCALREFAVLGPDGEVATVDYGAIQVGPEGYALSYSAGRYVGSSYEEWDSYDRSHTVGLRGEACIGFEKALGDVIGISAKACAYTDNRTTWSYGDRETDVTGEEQRSTASFAAGLRLPNTPFPELPAGALLAVEVPQGATARNTVRNVHVVRTGQTAVFVEDDADVYLVVNDRGCDEASPTPFMQVGVGVLAPQGQVAEAALDEMAAVLGSLRQSQATYVRQGSISSTELRALESEAWIALEERIEDLPVGSLPEPVRELFQAYLDRELARLERAVLIRQQERAQGLVLLDLAALEEEARLVEQRGRLAELVPAWTLRSLDSEGVRSVASQTVDQARRFLFPILELWYPDALEDIRYDATAQDIRDDLSLLRQASLSSSTLDLAQTASQVIQRLVQVYANTQPGDPDSGTMPPVALSFQDPDGDSGGFGISSDLPKAADDPTGGPTRAQVVWSALDERGVGTFVVRPEDVYALGGTGGHLTCTTSTPVIERMAVMVLTNDSGPDAETKLQKFNQYRTLTGRSSVRQPFASADGMISYDLEGEGWDTFDVPLLYASYETPLDKFFELTGDASRPLGAFGRSPFGVFEIDFGPFTDFAAGSVGTGLDDAVEIALVMQVSTRVSPTPMEWVSSCQPSVDDNPF